MQDIEFILTLVHLGELFGPDRKIADSLGVYSGLSARDHSERTRDVPREP